MIPHLFQIPLPFGLGALPIHSFGLMMMFAFLAAWRRLALSLFEAGQDPALAERMITWAAIGGIIGAKFGYVASYPEDFFQAPLRTLFSGTGFVFYGGFIGGAFAVWLLLRKESKVFLEMADLSGPALAIGYAIGRIGCQLAGDGDYGGESTLPWAMSYALGVVPTPSGVRVHPAPVYETIMAFGITGILLSTWTKTRFSATGQRFGLYLMLSAIARFLVEIIRIEPRVWLGLTQAQLVGVGLFGVGLCLLAAPRREATSFNSEPGT